MNMNKQFIALTISVLTIFSAAAAGNANNGNKLQCFSGTEDGGFNGTCALLGGGCASLDTVDNDTDPNNAYAGVYVSPGLPGKPISDVKKLSFTFDGGPVAGGSPRLSIPIDVNGDGTTDAYAFIDAANCGLTSGGTVGLSCPVAFGDVLYTDWAAFVAANPTYRIGRDALAFVIVDQPFQGTVCDVQLGKATAR